MRININTQKSYEIAVENGFGSLSAELLRLFTAERSLFIITDENVSALYGDELSGIIKNCCEKAFILPLAPGESSKSLETLSVIYSFLLKNGADRSSVLIALGGGVIGDLTGFAAATYMRGVSYVQIPTTLLSQVDSSVGGKTAVDFEGSKNIVGAFYQPDFVYINPDSLKTLPPREFSAGMAEVIKYGLIMDDGFYDFIADNIENIRDNEVLAYIISKCVELKAKVVEEDEKDTGIREILNFGHTFGHAVESLAEFEYLHGECVALGMYAALELSFMRGGVSREEIAGYGRLLERLNLPLSTELCGEKLYEAMLKDKKTKSGEITYIVLEKIGLANGVKGVTRNDATVALRIIAKGE